MIITLLNGGLGNQMFQYAAGKALACKHNTPLLLDIDPFSASYQNQTPRVYDLHHFNISASIASPHDFKGIAYSSKLFNRIAYAISSRIFPNAESRFLYYVKESHFEYEPFYHNAPRNCYLHGYWQSEKYFKDIRQTLLKEFTLKNNLDSTNKSIVQHMHKTNAVALHVRRGDYVTNNATNQAHGTCSLDYYKNAIEYINHTVPNPVYFIFSDDIQWCKDSLTITHEVQYIDNNQGAGYIDITLMSHCKHFIIANSSFSWWGAWLSQHQDKKIIAPQQWFADKTINTSDLIPAGWIRL